MNRRGYAGLLLLATLTWGCSVSGSGTGGDARVAEFKKRFVLEQEPPGAQPLSEAKETVASGATVVLIGRVGAGSHEAFDTGRAAFVVGELPSADHEGTAGHDVDNCPFCKRKAAAAPTAVVQFLDDQGQVVPIDARTLFGLEKGQVVVVQGQGEWNEELNMYKIAARGIHVRR